MRSQLPRKHRATTCPSRCQESQRSRFMIHSTSWTLSLRSQSKEMVQLRKRAQQTIMVQVRSRQLHRRSQTSHTLWNVKSRRSVRWSPKATSASYSIRVRTTGRSSLIERREIMLRLCPQTFLVVCHSQEVTLRSPLSHRLLMRRRQLRRIMLAWMAQFMSTITVYMWLPIRPTRFIQPITMR